MQHIIRTQTIQLELSREADAFEMQHLMSRHYRHSVVPALEKLFDEVCPEGETICIDKIEIDLGLLTYKDMYSHKWSEALLSGLAKQFYEKISAGAAGAKATVQLQSTRLGLVQQWLYYMQKGHLPWNTLHIDEAWKQQALEALAQDQESISTLRKLLLTNSSVVRRITAQHKPDFLLQLTELLAAAKLSRLPVLLQELELVLKHVTGTSAGSPTISGTGIRSQLWSQVLRLTATPGQKPDEKTIALKIVEASVGRPASLQEVLQNSPVQLTQLLPLLTEWLADKSAAAKEIADPIPFKRTTTDKLQETVESQHTTSGDEAEAEEILVDEDGIFVQHAGLVLLHPFLSTFFGRLQLTKEGKFTGMATRQKALYLLHYLATGEHAAEEYELVIPKVLCAYPLQQPVSEIAGLQTEETAEADQLLAEVIRQWDVLKSTTPEGLRAEFLQRNGKLITKNNKPHLQLEASPVDILLDYLPWNLSLIKLPWMKELLRVEWR